MSKLICLLFIVFFSCGSQNDQSIIIDEIPRGQMEFQKMIIGQLSGEVPLQTKRGKSLFLKGRWNSIERKLSAAYFKQVLEKVGVTPEIHRYTLPNTNFAIDLLIEPLKGRNIHATLPSTTVSDEYVVIGAHYDTGGRNVPGAIDNGSGIALILSVMRKAIELEIRNKNLMIVFFDQEEEGMSAGSIAFAKYLNSSDFNIHSVHSFDMIGWDSDNNKEVEIEMPSEEIEDLYKKHAAILNIPIYATNINSSDHYSFIKAGINAVGVSHAYGKGDNSGKKDTPDDKYHLVDFEYLESSSNLAFEVIKDIIND